jgi:hypothetical protein
MPSLLARLRMSPRSAQGYTLIFVHMPKTAGISLREVLLRQMHGRPQFRILHPVADVERLAALPAEERSRLELVEGHMYYGMHELIGRECRYITMLRDPVERVLSWYSYVLENDWHHLYQRIAEDRLSLATCIREHVSVELDNHMVRTLAGQRHIDCPFGQVAPGMLEEAKANLQTFAAVGISERFDESLALFARTFGWRRARPRRANITARRLRREHLDDETLALLARQNELDGELYRFAGELFHAQLARAVAAR